MLCFGGPFPKQFLNGPATDRCGATLPPDYQFFLDDYHEEGMAIEDVDGKPVDIVDLYVLLS